MFDLTSFTLFNLQGLGTSPPILSRRCGDNNVQMSVLEAVLQTLKTLRFDNSTASSNTSDAEYENLEASVSILIELRLIH